MDFFTTHNSPIAININGTAYSLPRFLLPSLKEWSAVLRKEAEDRATKEFDADGKARFLMYYQHPPVDIVQMMRMAIGAEGADYVVSASMKAGGVPDDLRKDVLAKADPLLIRHLADQLVQAEQVIQQQGASVKPDPLPSTPGASGVSPETTTPTTPDSAPSTETSQTV